MSTQGPLRDAGQVEHAAAQWGGWYDAEPLHTPAPGVGHGLHVKHVAAGTLQNL
ncbi:hypothetical protein [Streptomyces sp. NPDC002769]|uniref:hypothetical protein n=1 Tax=Streptomyces sp. NPDC002769 TaxID=3154542 RepID=UPI0033241FA8